MTIERRRALVTGGSGAIGAAICRRLAASGHFVLVHAHQNARAASTLVEELNDGATRAAPVLFDVTDADATHKALSAILED